MKLALKAARDSGFRFERDVESNERNLGSFASITANFPDKYL